MPNGSCPGKWPQQWRRRHRLLAALCLFVSHFQERQVPVGGRKRAGSVACGLGQAVSQQFNNQKKYEN